MQSTTVTIGQEVWITGGLDKGKKGIVVSGGWGVYQVQLDSETKTYDQHSVSTTNPKSHNVPLPPSFIPLDHKVGDKVIIEGFHMEHYNGVVGTVERVPNSVASFGFEGRTYRIKGSKTSAYPDSFLDFLPKFLKPYKAVRMVGEEIGHEDVRIGDTIRTELRSADGTYSRLSTKEGRVACITKLNATGIEPWAIYSFTTEKHHGLTFGQHDEKITLLGIAVDPYVAIVDNLAAGTVVVHEKESGAVLTYVKSLPFVNQSQWHVVSSYSNRSSTFVDDRNVIDALHNGAEIVHKVRKPKPVAVPF